MVTRVVAADAGAPRRAIRGVRVLRGGAGGWIPGGAVAGAAPGACS